MSADCRPLPPKLDSLCLSKLAKNGSDNMGQFRRTTLEKRRREQTRKQKQLEKQQRRVKRAAERRLHPEPAAGQEADLAGLIPGPQPGRII